MGTGALWVGRNKRDQSSCLSLAESKPDPTVPPTVPGHCSKDSGNGMSEVGQRSPIIVGIVVEGSSGRVWQCSEARSMEFDNKAVCNRPNRFASAYKVSRCRMIQP